MVWKLAVMGRQQKGNVVLKPCLCPSRPSKMQRQWMVAFISLASAGGENCWGDENGVSPLEGFLQSWFALWVIGAKLWRGAPLRGCNCLLWLPDSKAVDVVRESWLQNAKAGAVNMGLTTFGSSPEGCQGAKGAKSAT